jgi:hypothetical protein
MIVQGTLQDSVDDGILYYTASAPADRRLSFAGSGMPFGDARQAFSRTPNQGHARLAAGGRFVIELHDTPNAYYDLAGSVLVPPTLFFRYTSGGREKRASLQLAAHGVPYRSLDHPAVRDSPTFYDVPHPVRGQEDILWDSAYPCSYGAPPNFWDSGRKPPL